MKAIEVRADIDVDDVPGPEHHVGPRDPVTHHLVPAGAHRGREPLVPELAGRAAATRGVLTYPADLRRGDAGREARADVSERLRLDAPGGPNQGALGRTEPVKETQARQGARVKARRLHLEPEQRRRAPRILPRATGAFVKRSLLPPARSPALAGSLGRAARNRAEGRLVHVNDLERLAGLPPREARSVATACSARPFVASRSGGALRAFPTPTGHCDQNFCGDLHRRLNLANHRQGKCAFAPQDLGDTSA